MHTDLNPDELKSRYKLGTVIFAAADVSVDDFLHRLPGISDLCRQVVVTVSDGDNVLKSARKVMGGEHRIGTEDAELIEEEFAMSRAIENFEIVDLSRGKEARGFDITGHHYWYRNPWASSDIIFLLRTDLPSHRRGLTPSEHRQVYYFGPGYPEAAREAIRKGTQRLVVRKGPYPGSRSKEAMIDIQRLGDARAPSSSARSAGKSAPTLLTTLNRVQRRCGAWRSTAGIAMVCRGLNATRQHWKWIREEAVNPF